MTTLKPTGPPARTAGRAHRPSAPKQTARKKQPLGARIWRDRSLLMLALPGILLLLLFHYFPLGGNVTAFQNYLPFLGIRGSEWVGWDNFSVIFNGDPAFLGALRNTLVMVLVQTVLVFPVPIVLALVLNSLLSERIKKVVQSVLYLPHFLSWVIVIALFQEFLGGSGLVNHLLRVSGGDPINFLTNPDTFFLLVGTQAIWKDAGWATILFLAALSQIDTQLYEASAMDGAGRWRQMWHITLPGLRGIIILLLILRLGDALSMGFEQVLLQQGAVGRDASEVLDTYVYNNGVINGQWGVAAAVGLTKGIVSVILVLGANKIAHLFGEAGVYQK